LTGGNLFFASPGAVLETCGVAIDEALLAAWRARVARAVEHVGWPAVQSAARTHLGGASLAIAAPCDQLFLATEINEWALCAALVERDPKRWNSLQSALSAAGEDTANAAGLAPVIEEPAAMERFARLAAREANSALCTLIESAAARGLPHVLDESQLTLGSGAGGRSFPLERLPAVADVPWARLHAVPTAIVTGSNGKTTTVRLLAACARACGWHTGYNCTDGVFLDEEVLASGDYSGPAGARMVMREARTQAAILETARGGILRRGIAVSHADTAIVTNISSDHFGEYGVDDLGALADVKLSVAATVGAGGLLVLNADDPLLRARAGGIAERFGRCPPLGWFALDADSAELRAHRRHGAPTCGVRDGRLALNHRGAEYDLGPIAQMPLSIGGAATYNVANLAGAALAAIALGIPAPVIATVFGRFGATRADNPGRMMRFERGGVLVLIDYAHNPEGLRGFLTVARHLRGPGGRFGLALGHAGNRQDAEIEELVRVAAEFRPDLVVVKENETQLRGRAPGEIPALIRAELLRLGFSAAAVPVTGSEIEAVRRALAWARPGDLLALPVHSAGARAAAMALFEEP
jgi:UDP-N-acetylmuramyl tripeptide synthase